MHLLKEVLRLTAAGLSQRQIARSLKLSNGLVAKYQAAGRRAGLSWPLSEALDDVALANQLCTKPAESAAVSAARVIPDFAAIHEQLKEKGVTRLLLWEEYRAAHPEELRLFAVLLSLPAVALTSQAGDAANASRGRKAVRGLRRPDRSHR